MPADRPDPRIETILAKALRKTDPAERAAFLDQTCEHDFALRQSVEEQIENIVRAGGSPGDETTGLDPDATEDIAADLGGPGAAGPIPSDWVVAGLGTHIGRYRLVEKIGEGGMVTIRARIFPDEWATFLVRSQLGACLLARKAYAEAEPLLILGYDGMKARQDKIPARYQTLVKEAGKRIPALYDAWDKQDKANEWRRKIGARSGDRVPGL